MLLLHTCITHVVKYAANVGQLGLDMDEVFTREELWNEKKLSLDLINSPLPWYPEQEGFCVCEVQKGNVTA